MSNQAGCGGQCPTDSALELRQFIARDVALVHAIDEVIEDFDFGPLGNPHEAGELLVPKSAKALSDVPGR
ncbi:MAG: hypothetical protein Q8T13_10115 [Acidobacteriota bacterium]|nr:hypothetical protein [Acidobacteriota bacterium]